MNSKKYKTSYCEFLLSLSDKIDLQRGGKSISLISIYYTWKNMKSTYKNDKFKSQPNME